MKLVGAATCAATHVLSNRRSLIVAVIVAYIFVAASGPAFGMATVLPQVTNIRDEFDVAVTIDSDIDAALPLQRLSLADAQPTLASDDVNDTALDSNASATDARRAFAIDGNNERGNTRPTTPLASNDALK